MNLFQVPPGEFRLSDRDPSNTHERDDEWIRETLEGNRRRIADIQNVLYAERKQSLLILLLSMDTGGKDPIIRDVLNLTNPQACRATAFKRVKGMEARHDRFWRFHLAMPEKGEIVVFNRSYYDEIVAASAHGDLTPDDLAARCRQINAFEYVIAEEQIRIVKIFLHISKEEQRRRLQERIDDPNRHWELSEADFEERRYWDGYMETYSAVISATNTDKAEWFVIPSDHRDFRDAAASVIIRSELERLNPQFPPAKFDLKTVEWY